MAVEHLALILLWAGMVTTIAFLLLFFWAVYYDFSRTIMPPGFDHPWKLRAVHWAFIMACSLGKITETLGLCKQVTILRFAMDFRKAKIHPSLSAKDLYFNGVPVRVYQPKAPSAGRRKGFVFIHGGAGMAGSIVMYQSICSKLAKDTDSVVVSVGYRLAPEYLTPTQYNDCYAATVHFIQNAEAYGVDPSQIIVGGDSAGGNFATMTTHKLVGRSDLPKLRAQVLIYPGVQAMDFNLPSYQQNAAMPLLFRESVAFYGLRFCRKDTSLLEDALKGCHVPDELRLKYRKWVSPENIPERFKSRGYRPSPLAPCKPEVSKQLSEFLQGSFSSLFAEDSVFQQLPEALIVTCEYDVFRDDGLLYKKRLEDNGVKVSWFHAENGFHGVINFFDVGPLSFPAGVEILDHIAEFIKHL